MHYKKALFLTTGLLLTACTPKYQYTHTFEKLFKTDYFCDFHVVSLVPDDKQYKEIGTINLKSGICMNQDSEQFKELIREDVCYAGGELVVASVNDSGCYIHGIVMKRFN